ncbi:hepatitis A virus cellular receptor 1 homolog isoform X2 [Aquarana catesbeiana]|uniref:hepatitis A virus cellular receptor 1 homolog isoform X2 n=1 Tax=Aquarana catesbeiana TaxID=8400 RepID=UPI003CCA04FA
MKQMCVAFYFFLLLVKGLFVSAKDVNGFVGGAVTLPCTYSIRDGTTSTCWGRGNCPSSKCNNPNIWTDGSKVTWNGFDSRYQLLGNIPEGDVSLTISNLSKMDEDTYCCRVEIPGWYNDQKHEISVRVHEEPKSTKPALTTWSLGLTHAPDYKHPEYRNVTSTFFTSMIPGISNGQQMVKMEGDLKSDHVNPIIAGVVVLIILLVSMVGLLFTWRYYKIKNKDKTRITGTRTLEGLQAAQTQAEQNIYTL